MNTNWEPWVTRWRDAGLIDAATAERIREYEHAHGRSWSLRWPVLIALAFGGLMICGGILLFVAANWDALSPAARFALVLLPVAGFHVAGAFVTERFPAMGETCHTIGTVALGAGVALAGQIFNLDEHWPGGVMLWALGAALAWWLLRHTTQMVLVAILVPAWLTSEWIVAIDRNESAGVIAAAGLFLLAIAYFTAPVDAAMTRSRRALMYLGATALAPSAVLLAFAAAELWDDYWSNATLRALYVFGWIAAGGGPVLLAFALNRLAAWPIVLAAAWTIFLLPMQMLLGSIAVYAWWALGAIGLVAWGLRDARTERINMGAIAFASTVIVFYFSQVMDKMSRSASLIGLGLLFLGGGWALERSRRRLVQRARGNV